MSNDYSTHTERDAALAAQGSGTGPADAYEMALERGYDPHEDYSESEEAKRANLALFRRGRRVAIDARNPESTLHEYAVKEAWAIIDAGFARSHEGLGLFSMGVGTHNLPRRSA